MGSSRGDFGCSWSAWYDEGSEDKGESEAEEGDNEVRGESEVNWASAAARVDAQFPSLALGEVIAEVEGEAKMITLGNWMDGEDDEDWKGKEKEEQQVELSTVDSFRIVCVASPPATIAAG